jgi:hypothetical protein
MATGADFGLGLGLHNLIGWFVQLMAVSALHVRQSVSAEGPAESSAIVMTVKADLILLIPSNAMAAELLGCVFEAKIVLLCGMTSAAVQCLSCAAGGQHQPNKAGAQPAQ